MHENLMKHGSFSWSELMTTDVGAGRQVEALGGKLLRPPTFDRAKPKLPTPWLENTP